MTWVFCIIYLLLVDDFYLFLALCLMADFLLALND